ncbi:MAG TPA: bifunctional 4-hydroxy-2-oxoglutarate aldolase/2-dehydro-3-deoxy-phosphogluconate aldolase [Puia sp.]|nr:bifunctional 4-hydroxy-2-oxoglutarate aldolase/2-dehydro-3-deoxy-phosphogluconate aldolase [Puia sp.]
MSTFHQILEHKIVAIIRGADPGDVLKIIQALFDGGIRIVEITLNSPHALHLIEAATNSFGDRMIIGAGTVLNAAAAKASVEKGARFIISPNLDIPTIEATRQGGAVSIPGAFTPTEIVNAYQHGGEIIKVFPAILGAGYFSDLRGPLPQIPLMPTGGINLDNIKAFHQAGAAAFGIGSSLVNSKEKMTDERLDRLVQKARDFTSAISQAVSI